MTRQYTLLYIDFASITISHIMIHPSKFILIHIIQVCEITIRAEDNGEKQHRVPHLRHCKQSQEQHRPTQSELDRHLGSIVNSFLSLNDHYTFKRTQPDIERVYCVHAKKGLIANNENIQI